VSVKEVGNFPTKFELPTDLTTKKSGNKRSGKFPAQNLIELPTDFFVGKFVDIYITLNP